MILQNVLENTGDLAEQLSESRTQTAEKNFIFGWCLIKLQTTSGYRLLWPRAACTPAIPGDVPVLWPFLIKREHYNAFATAAKIAQARRKYILLWLPLKQPAGDIIGISGRKIDIL